MKQIIKLSEEHYIIIDNSEINKNNELCFNKKRNRIEPVKFMIQTSEFIFCKKISHSTIPIEKEKCFDRIKQIPLSEVEKTIFGYSVQELVEKETDNQTFLDNSLDYAGFYQGYIKGFNAHKEILKTNKKDKNFTLQDVEKAFQEGIDAQFMTAGISTYEKKEQYRKIRLETFLKSMTAKKSEWYIKEITPEGKIILL